MDEFVAFDVVSYLKKYSDSHTYKIRLNAVYSLLNIAAATSIAVKSQLLEKELIVKLQRMMLEDEPSMRKLCAYFFTNLLFEADERFIVSALQDYEFLRIAKLIFEKIADVDVVCGLLKTIDYILQTVAAEDNIIFVLKQFEYYKII